MNIETIKDNAITFFNWIYSQTGLKTWQMVAITLGVLFLLYFILFSLRKLKSKRVYLNQNTNRSDCIGIKLTGKPDNYKFHHQPKEQSLAFGSEEDEEQKSWGQTTKDWRKLREKIRQLQHDLSKYEKTEKYLKEQISELKSSNEKLKAEISERAKNEVKSASTQELTQEASSIKTESPEESINTNIDDSLDTSETEREAPLDIKELKAIADLAKRLKSRSQQRQN